MKKEVNNLVSPKEVFVVSYDVFGYQSDIESFLFLASQIDEREASQLRDEYEKEMADLICSVPFEEPIPETKPFETWLFEKGIWCSKVRQIRVQPMIEGHAKNYDSICLETKTAFC